MQKFKLNDWGIPNNSNKPEQITEIQENDKYYIENKGGIGGRVYNKEQLQKWKPEKNEYCWTTSPKGFPILVQYTGDYWENKVCNQYKMKTHSGELWCLLKNLEPFIGDLPTSTKE